MSVLRLVVIGAGPMGRLHARAIARRAERFGDCVLGCVVDRNLARSQSVAGEFGGRALTDLDACWGEVDAAVVAVPTRAHRAITCQALGHGLDVLVEKPMSTTIAEARKMLELASDRDLILGVGHVEWYNGRLQEALQRAGIPVRIEVERLNPVTDRGLDIDVVQDFMLHDLDWVTRVVRSEIIGVEASGRAVVNGRVDEAEANLVFASGCRARLRASRVHSERIRRVRIEGAEATVDVDLLADEKPAGFVSGSGRIDGLEPLDAQWADFVHACRSRRAPANDGAIGLGTLEIVERVRAAIADTTRGAGHAHDPSLGR